MLESTVTVTFGVAGGALATWAARSAARRFGIVNHPNPIVPQHTRPVAYLGGIGLAAGTALALIASTFIRRGPVGAPPAAIVIPALLFLVLGVFDDLRPMRPGRKFVSQMLLTVLAVALGARGEVSGWRPADSVISALWILSLMNAFNFTDVCDGLVGGLSAIAFSFLALLAPVPSALPLSAAGACLGFLVFNRPPATIFLGDAGSHFVGFLVAALTLTNLRPGHPWPWVGQAALIAGVPIFELIFLTLVRISKGLPWWRGSPDHFSLRLQQAGLSRWQTDAIAWADAGSFGIAAFCLARAPIPAQVLLVGCILAVHGWFGILLLRWEVKVSR